jgi:hypothetical protein
LGCVALSAAAQRGARDRPRDGGMALRRGRHLAYKEARLDVDFGAGVPRKEQSLRNSMGIVWLFETSKQS